MSAIGRNDPCPCGSGKKYKQCCLGKAPEVEEAQGKKMLIPGVLIALSVAAGIGVGISRDLGDGLVVAIAGLLFAAGYAVLRNPPPSNPHSGSPGGIDFGR